MKKYTLIAIVPLMLSASLATAAPFGSAIHKEAEHPPTAVELRAQLAGTHDVFVIEAPAAKFSNVASVSTLIVKADMQPALHKPTVVLKYIRAFYHVPKSIGRPDTKRHYAWRCRVRKLC